MKIRVMEEIVRYS
jgi:hypothetical protein